MSDKISDFGLALIFLLCFPLLPLGFEYWISGTVAESAAIVISSMYSFSIAFATRRKMTFAFALLVGVILAMAYGATMIKPHSLVYAMPFSIIAIVCFFVTHSMERYVIHVIEGETFMTLK